jgi:hypothetical protein
MNSRRRISASKLISQHCIGSNEYFDRGQTGHQNTTAVHSRCLRWIIFDRGTQGGKSRNVRSDLNSYCKVHALVPVAMCLFQTHAQRKSLTR